MDRIPLTATERSIIVNLYVVKELPILAVSIATGRSTSAVWKVLAAEGVTRRRPGRQPGQPPVPRGPRNSNRLSPQAKADIVRQYQTGFTIAEVASKTRRGIGTVSRVLDEEGIPRRRPGPRTRHFCGTVSRHFPHDGCNGFGLDAGPPEALCSREDLHTPHLSCDGRGAGK